MKLTKSSLVLIIALVLSAASLGVSLTKTAEPAGGYVSYGTWVSTFNILNDAVTSAKIANYTIANYDLATTGVVNSSQLVDAKVNLSGDSMTGNLNMTNKTINAVSNITFTNTSQAYIYWNGTALIIQVP